MSKKARVLLAVFAFVVGIAPWFFQDFFGKMTVSLMLVSLGAGAALTSFASPVRDFIYTMMPATIAGLLWMLVTVVGGHINHGTFPLLLSALVTAATFSLSRALAK